MAKKEVSDHLGNKFSSITAFCLTYGITEGQYRYKIKKGETPEQIAESLLPKVDEDFDVDNARRQLEQFRCDDSIFDTGVVASLAGEIVEGEFKDADSVDVNTIKCSSNANQYMGISKDRARRMLGVAKKCYSLAINLGYKEIFACKMYALGYLHDIGYAFSEKEDDHIDVGVGLLATLGVTDASILTAVKKHEIICRDMSIESKILMAANVLTDSNGEEIEPLRGLFNLVLKYGISSKEFITPYIIFKGFHLIDGDVSKYDLRLLGKDLSEVLHRAATNVPKEERNDNVSIVPQPIIEATITDHEGNRFQTEEEMCQHWGISCNTYKGRRSTGWDMKSALTVPVQAKERGACVDFLGNRFASKMEMLDAWGVPQTLYHGRLYSKWQLERILITPSANRVVDVSLVPDSRIKLSVGKDGITDHFGNKYSSVVELCNFYGVAPAVYAGRICRGVEQRQALCAVVSAEELKMPFTDHEGTGYATMRDMTEHWGIPLSIFFARIQAGWGLSKALKTRV